MLRALFEIEVDARPGAGHERRGPERRDGRPRPDAGGDRPAHRALAGRQHRPGDLRPAAADGTPGGLDRHPPLLLGVHAAAAGRGVRRDDVRGAAGPLPGVRGQHRARRRALVHRRPAGRRDHGQRRRPRAAAAGARSAASTSSTAASSTPSRSAGPSCWAPTGSSCSRSAGSTGRCTAADSGRGRSPASRSRSPGATASPASWPRCPMASRCTCCPPAVRRPRDDSLLAHRDFSRVRHRIDASYEASRDYLAGAARDLAAPAAA